MHTITLISPAHGQATLARLWEWAKPRLADGKRLRLSVGEEKRSLPQNARLWAMLGEVSRQVDWHGQKLADAEWKDVFSASLKRQKVVPGLDGGFVVLGSSTSKMSKAELSDLMELIAAFGAEHGVRFSDAD